MDCELYDGIAIHVPEGARADVLVHTDTVAVAALGGGVVG